MVICFSSEVDESSKLPIISRWGNLADNPGGELAWFTFFFFGVVSFEKDCAVVTGKSADADADANCFSSEVDESSKLPIISRWDNLSNNPGGRLEWFTFFFFGVVSFKKDCAIVTSKSADADANAADDDGGNNNADDADGGNDNDEKDGDNNDNCRFDSNDAIFFVSAELLFDLPFLTTFVGVTIEIDGLHLLEVLASDSV